MAAVLVFVLFDSLGCSSAESSQAEMPCLCLIGHMHTELAKPVEMPCLCCNTCTPAVLLELTKLAKPAEMHCLCWLPDDATAAIRLHTNSHPERPSQEAAESSWLFATRRTAQQAVCYKANRAARLRGHHTVIHRRRHTTTRLWRPHVNDSPPLIVEGDTSLKRRPGPSQQAAGKQHLVCSLTQSAARPRGRHRRRRTPKTRL